MLYFFVELFIHAFLKILFVCVSLQRWFFNQLNLGFLMSQLIVSLGKWGLLFRSLAKDVTGALMSAGLSLAGNSWIGLLTWFPVHAQLEHGLHSAWILCSYELLSWAGLGAILSS